MRKLLTGLMVLAALAFTSTSWAANGTVEMAWNGCVGVQDITTTAAGQYSLYLSELGNDVPNNAYQVRVIYGDQTQNVPDAWRFDAAGCQGSSFITLDHLAPATVVKTCPSFQGALQSLQIKDCSFTPPVDPYATTTMRIVLANSYPAGVTPNPAQRYFLARFLFDHSFSVAGPTNPGVNCGGFDSPICFKLTTATYLDMSPQPQEISFDRNVAPGAPLFVTFNGGAACSAVPARPATWGAIKGQYRN